MNCKLDIFLIVMSFTLKISKILFHAKFILAIYCVVY